MIRAFAHLTPKVLRQIIYQTSLPTNQFKQLVEELLAEHCTKFVEHSRKWTYNCRNPDILTRMVQYHRVWEGFASSEPWFNSNDQKLRYFFDINYDIRLDDMDIEFYRDL